MALPMLKQIKRKHPESHITWLCGKSVADLLRQFKEIDELLVIDEVQLVSGSLLQRLTEMAGIWKKLLFKKFDLQLYFYYSNLYKLLLLPASFGEIRRFNKNPKNRINPVPARHHSAAYVATFEQLEGSFQLELDYPTFHFHNPEFLQWRSAVGSKKVAVLSCGGAKNFLRSDDLRRWPIDRYVALGEKLIEAGFHLVLSGAPSDNWVTDHFQHLSFENKIGKLDLKNFISFLSVCNVLITHDSGPLHLADLANCPVVGIFGPTNPGDFRSLQPRSVHLWGGENLSCRPCYDGRMYANCAKSICLETISVHAVFASVQKVISSKEQLISESG